MKTARIRAWILLDYDLPYLRKMIDLAPGYGINQIQFSHAIAMFAEEILNEPQRADDLRELIGLAQSRGLETYLWSHEIAGLPESLRSGGQADFDNPKLHDWIGEKYNQLFNTLPGLSGIVMTYSETEFPIFDDRKVHSILPHRERIARLTESIWRSCRRHGKGLIMRDWANVGTGSWEELGEFQEGLKSTDPEIIIMTKHTAGDWYLLADNPLMGAVGNHPQICEFDLCGEHHGNQVAPWYCPEYIRERWRWALSKGAAGAAGRTERYDRHVLGTPGEVNLAAFSRVLQDPDTPVDAIWNEWATTQFGPAAAPRVISALKRTDEIILKTFYARRVYWGSDHSRIPAFDYLRDHLKAKTAVPFNPEFGPVEQDLLNPRESTLAWILYEKDEALALVEASLEDIEAARLDLRERDYLYLRDALEKSAALVSLFRQINEACFHVYFVERSDGPGRQRWAEAFARSSVLLLAAGDRIFRRWGTDFALAGSHDERSYVAKALPRLLNEMQKRVEKAMAE